MWQKLPEGWLEFHDSITQQPYYYNPTTRQKTWARPVEQELAATTVTATRLMSMEQPRSCLPSFNKRRSGSLVANQTANSSSSALSGKEEVPVMLTPAAAGATGATAAAVEVAAAGQQVPAAAAAAPVPTAVQPMAGA